MSHLLWVIMDKDGHYWSGKYTSSPWCRRARWFDTHLKYAKKYSSKAIALRSAKIMEKNGVFTKKDYYVIKEVLV